MHAIQCSPGLPNLLTALKQLAPQELLSRLSDPDFMKEWTLSNDEKQAVMKALSKGRATEERSNWWT